MTGDASGLFDGGGESGRAMAALDWAATPLGAPGTWPAGLRNAVRILLTSRFAMWAAWGPELSFFYNDAYRHDTLQAKHPWALGRPAWEVWAEIWDEVGPRVRSVLETGVATWDEDLMLVVERSGYPEETYHTFSYSPLAGEDGRPAGMLCVVTENTRRVVGERRTATLRDLAPAVATARDEAGLLAAVAEQLGRNPADLPVTATYLLDPDGSARLGCATGLPAGAVPPAEAWPVERLRAGEVVLVEDAAARFPDLPTGAWDRPPVQAVALPVAGASADAEAAGFLAVGLNPHRRWDDDYRGFLELLAGQVAAGLVNAGSHEAERRRAEALAELDRAKTDFFSNVSHEFRTPLTLIQGPVAELREHPVLAADPRAREELEVVERNAARLGKLVNTLLDFSRLQAGRVEARYEPVDLAAVTAELASVFRSAVARAGLSYEVDCPPLGVPVHVDRDMWEKVVLNLLSNALKHTFEGGIAVRLRRDGDAVRFAVTDTGTGVPAGELPRLFERFHRVAGARGRSGEGSGIGLAMVRELVGLHGGAITAESTLGAGSTFTVTLPLGSGHLPPDRVAAAALDGPAVSPAAAPFVTEALRWLPGADDPGPVTGHAPAEVPGGRVLVADDNADMRGYVTRLLAGRHAVRTAADGRAALASALADPPDLVVSDVMMPGLDGMQLLAALRADARTARVPVLLLSARAGEEAAVEGLAAGADDYLVKPFSAQELLARVDAHVQLGRARRSAEERFTALADLAPALIWLADGDGGRVFVNSGWTAFTGRDAGAELGAGWRDGIHPDDLAGYEGTVARARAGGTGWEVEYRLRRADGTYHWLLERAAPVPGEPAGGVMAVCTDIDVRYREGERQALLAEVGAALDRDMVLDGQLGALARLLVDRRVGDLCTVRVLGDDGRLRFAGVAGLGAAAEAAMAAVEPASGLGPEVLATGRTILLDQLPPAPVDRPELADALAVGSGMAVPLTVRGRVLAVLGLARRPHGRRYDEEDRRLVEEIAARAALAVQNAILLADERAGARRLALLQRATAELSAATTPVAVAAAAAGHVRALTGDESRVAVYELDDSHRALVALEIDGASDDGRRAWQTLPLSAPLVGPAAVQQRRALWVEDATGTPEDPALAPELAGTIREYGLGACVGLPLVVAGRAVGVVSVAWPAPRRVPPTDRAMLLAVAEQCAQALDRARLHRAERRIAETLQRSLLPAGLPRLERLALAAHYLPGAEGAQAGGDWYDVVDMGRGSVAIAVGDVVGQGPAAAAVMGQLRSALSTALLQGCGPAEALEVLDRFAGRLPGALASTAAVVLLDAAAGTVRWARAGHPPALLVTGEGTRLLDGAGAGTVLGVPGRPPYREGVGTLPVGATLLLYTDGLVERRDEVLDTGLERVQAVAARHADAAPGRLTARLLAEVLADTDQPDDVALIAVRLLPPPLTGRLPADPARLAGVRRRVAAWAAAGGLPEETTDDLQLAVGEALANAVEHAYPSGDGWCSYRLARDGDGDVRVEVADGGAWRPPPADRGFRGRGLELIAALGTGVAVDHAGEAGTTVRFRVPVTPGPDAPPARRRPAVPGAGPPEGTADLVVTDDGDAGGPRLRVRGEVDLAGAETLGAGLLARLAALPAGSAAVLDLRGTTHLASAGVGVVLAALARAGELGVALRVEAEPGTAPYRILALAGVGEDPTEGPAPR
ncbi:SpoIIE family protein phosphatase [Geodermatophilus marinus]|uniref:SpoIIE family protein phosphatase n=1 Tax=Geodermatophilus sp. LHW52908 TaxID=2303986 RepID=UPI000E3E4B40|nr:SpoIIE family protein phosphatase [Geodermatophilus sp. LHW52908]RFU20222.1 response regulator [Geodermatophilus sp. LHW52908]